MATIQTGVDVLMFISETSYEGYTVKRTNLGATYNGGTFLYSTVADAAYGTYEIIRECEVSIPVAEEAQTSRSLGRRTERHVAGIKTFEGTVTKSRDSYAWFGAARHGFDNGATMSTATYHSPRYHITIYEGVTPTYAGWDTGARPQTTPEYVIETKLWYCIFTNYSADRVPGEIVKETIDFKYEKATTTRGTGYY